MYMSVYRVETFGNDFPRTFLGVLEKDPYSCANNLPKGSKVFFIEEIGPRRGLGSSRDKYLFCVVDVQRTLLSEYLIPKIICLAIEKGA